MAPGRAERGVETTVAQYAEEVRARSFPTEDQTYQPKR